MLLHWANRTTSAGSKAEASDWSRHFRRPRRVRQTEASRVNARGNCLASGARTALPRRAKSSMAAPGDCFEGSNQAYPANQNRAEGNSGKLLCGAQ